MMIADGLVPIWHQDIYDDHDDVGGRLNSYQETPFVMTLGLQNILKVFHWYPKNDKYFYLCSFRYFFQSWPS